MEALDDTFLPLLGWSGSGHAPRSHPERMVDRMTEF
jgi:hypothetical protein